MTLSTYSTQIQVRTPLIKRTLIERTSSVTESESFKNTAVSRIGHHNDCFLASDTDYGTYSSSDRTDEYTYLQDETKYVAMGGETCTVNSPR